MTGCEESAQNARMVVARELAVRWTAEPGVRAVLCTGSTGRGHADRWSDLEMCVLWERSPGLEPRERLAGENPRLFDYDPGERQCFDEWWVDGGAGSGLLVETAHITADDAHIQLDQLLGGAAGVPAPDPRPELLALASALAYGRVLSGDATPWTSRVATYPRSVAAVSARRNGQIDFLSRWETFRDRGDPHGMHVLFASAADAVVHLLCALNRRWWTGRKWPARQLTGLPIAPPRAAERLAEAAQRHPAEAAAMLTALVTEVYDLVERHLPEVDTPRLREIFAFHRRPWPRGHRPSDLYNANYTAPGDGSADGTG